MSSLDVRNSLAVPGIAPSAPATPVAVSRGAATELDDFAWRAGPDVAVGGDLGLARLYVVFQVDPATKEMRVSVIDDSGRLVRVIPPDSVGQMIAAMTAYGGR